MAVAVEMDFRGATAAQYDQILEKAGLTPGGATPTGAIAHWVAETDDGLHIVDVWESREVFDQYMAEYIGPYSAEVGMTEPPEQRFYDVHNYLTRA
jgi:hypothetical protein